MTGLTEEENCMYPGRIDTGDQSDPELQYTQRGYKNVSRLVLMIRPIITLQANSLHAAIFFHILWSKTCFGIQTVADY